LIFKYKSVTFHQGFEYQTSPSTSTGHVKATCITTLMSPPVFPHGGRANVIMLDIAMPVLAGAGLNTDGKFNGVL
jgi:prepilin-type processing-associated H-X9-DG protein